MASERIQRRIERLMDQIEEAADQLKWVEVQERANAQAAVMQAEAPDEGDGVLDYSLGSIMDQYL